MLDVSQHLLLCRAYVRGLRAVIETPSGEELSDTSKDGLRLGPFLRNGSSVDHAEGPSTPLAPPSVDDRDPYEQAADYLEGGGLQGGGHDPLRTSPGRRQTLETLETTNSNSSMNRVTRADIRASSEKILYTYLIYGAEREIIIPRSILREIVREVEENMRDDPEVFDDAKDYVFSAMERDAFPGFLQWKGLGNLIPTTLLLRTVLGLGVMYAAFTTAFVLIFLDAPRRMRLWVRRVFISKTF